MARSSCQNQPTRLALWRSRTDEIDSYSRGELANVRAGAWYGMAADCGSAPSAWSEVASTGHEQPGKQASR